MRAIADSRFRCAALVALLSLAHPAQAQSDSSTPTLEEAIARCNGAAGGPVKFQLQGVPVDAEATLPFHQQVEVVYEQSLQPVVARLEVWIDGERQLVAEGPELRSFQASGLAVRIPLVPVPPGEPRDRLLADGRYAFTPSPGKAAVVDVLLSTVGVGAAPACGVVHEEIGFGRIATFAIAIGFNYADTDHKLQYAQNDAEAMVRHFVGGMKISPDDVWLITDDRHAAERVEPNVHILSSTDPDALPHLVDTIMEMADPASRLFLYYSGHMMLPSQRNAPMRPGPQFFLPTSDPEKLSTQLNRHDFISKLMSANFDSAVVILDACYSGSGDVSMSYGGGGAPPSPPKYWRAPDAALPPDSLESSKARAVLSSSQGTSPSWELDDFQHGVFTYYLLEGAADPAPVSLSSAFSHAKARMAMLKPKGWQSPFRQKPDDEWRHGANDIAWVTR